MPLHSYLARCTGLLSNASTCSTPRAASVAVQTRPYPTTLDYDVYMSCYRWLLLESIVGTSQVGVNRPDVPNGLDTVEFTMQVAANNSQTTARVFAHGINSTLALQPEQGMLLAFCCVRSSAYQCQKMQMHHFKING